MMVIKKDGTIEEFEREKILNSLLKACNKRQISSSKIENTVNNITNYIYKEYVKEIKSSQIGEKIMEELKRIDEVAYVRFASVYKQFKDVDSFVNELKNILQQKEKENSND